jgi:phosphatidylglycerol:prolipoprotein diacylglycerol transferase
VLSYGPLVRDRIAKVDWNRDRAVFPTLLQIGPLRLPAYATLLSLGLVGGVVLTVWQGPRRGLAPTTCFDAALLAAIGGLVGARVAYVIENWAYYRDHLGEGVRLWSGGLAWQGGLALGLLLVALYGARLRLSLRTVFDVLTLGLAWFTLFVWLGSGAANDVYGRETFPTEGFVWSLSADLPDLYGLRAPRVNVPLLGIIWSGFVSVALWLAKGWLRVAGSLFFTYLMLTGLGGLALVQLQANAVPYLFRVRADWLFYLLLMVSGLAGLFVLALRAISNGRRTANHG